MVIGTYLYSKGFPKEELFALGNQIRRSVVSVAANIAEGFARTSKKEKARFMNIAQGSLEETRYFLLLAMELGYGDSNQLQETAEEVSRMLYSYRNKILISSKVPG